MNDLRIVFMGTPDFAVPSLQILVENGFTIAGVITAPDKPQGRGRKLAPSPVKMYAESVGLRVLQPVNLKDPAFLNELKSLNVNLQIVVAFRMLPEVVWNMPALGTFNLHASLLPDYRGAAPIHWAIINGEKETGVTTFFLKHEIDTGEIIFQEKEEIRREDNVGSLYERLMTKGANLVLKTTQAIESGSYPSMPQAENQPLHAAPKIFREDCQINFNQPSEKVYNFIRGLSPFPSAWLSIDDQIVKILKAHISGERKGMPGTISTDQKSFWHIHTADGSIAIDELQWQGKKRMQIGEFLLGNRIPEKPVNQ
ncbi:methionyl-tRNA formyltransferase [Fulvivirga sedimenti]|uniref:Methionyl-tRNA formyltransferase n=1 Tax=Fulvivirga sedimenti TaxID=2879465 RepID=A0A9X1L0Y0_9BACT|nr:methionyl-tRNA formyltransferase [Fulvivirga sedimenti]MCA6075367.1 methionyl-tRNA formyltransferase [Fulvivirga sedimenti]MCA6076544.1 methionyl-tRNA formyltransferase [Fulvivirga sedimenti]MCA6077672.1 methionyl-tRNA formyltransferase [Fulvivirga sedimenti]